MLDFLKYVTFEPFGDPWTFGGGFLTGVGLGGGFLVVPPPSFLGGAVAGKARGAVLAEPLLSRHDPGNTPINIRAGFGPTCQETGTLYRSWGLSYELRN